MKRKALVVMLFMFSMIYVMGQGAGLANAAGDKGITELSDFKGKTFYLAYNLHPDSRNNRLYSVNYQLDGGLVPWGTEVEVAKIGSRKAVLINTKTKDKYVYAIHKKTKKATSLVEHFKKMLVSDIKPLKKKVASLSKLDQKGIKEGHVKVGMSKKGTLIALGYPPEFVTPDPMATGTWNYWYNRFKKFVVTFDAKGKVSQLNGYPFK
ncbi:MAG: hypothetical protein OEL66_03175 [Desulfobulbaceae bacterium]|nr:hypothetical protein [Desulfobulbaceae bacterium]